MPGAASRSFDELVAAHAGAVARVCRSILRDDELARDAAQEAFLRLWRQVEVGGTPDRVGAWLRRAALSASLDIARRREARGRAEADASIARASAEAGASAPESRASLAELEAALERALAELSDGQRTVFLLRHRGGLSLSEVAEALGVALPTVKTQFARACLKLQSRLAPFTPSEKPR
jgi:RNA polymerase sigma-70 factor (ECF subfamily)